MAYTGVLRCNPLRSKADSDSYNWLLSEAYLCAVKTIESVRYGLSHFPPCLLSSAGGEGREPYQ